MSMTSGNSLSHGIVIALFHFIQFYWVVLVLFCPDKSITRLSYYQLVCYT